MNSSKQNQDSQQQVQHQRYPRSGKQSSSQKANITNHGSYSQQDFYPSQQIEQPAQMIQAEIKRQDSHKYIIQQNPNPSHAIEFKATIDPTIPNTATLQSNKHQIRQLSQDQLQHFQIMQAQQMNLQFVPSHHQQQQMQQQNAQMLRLQQQQQNALNQSAISQMGGRKGSMPSTTSNFNSNMPVNMQSKSSNQINPQSAKQTFKQSQIITKNQPLINKGKLIKSHAKYFSQQNSPVHNGRYQQNTIQQPSGAEVMQSGAGMIQQDRDSSQGDYTQSKNSLIPHGGGGASGGRLGRGVDQLQQNTGNFGAVSHQTLTSQGGEVPSNGGNAIDQRRSMKNYSQLSQHSVHSMHSHNSNNGGRVAGNYAQQQQAQDSAYFQQQQFQGNKPQKLNYLKNQKQIPSKYSNSGNLDNDPMQEVPGSSLTIPAGAPLNFNQGRLSVQGAQNAMNNRPMMNQKSVMNSDHLPQQPSQSYIKQYHSINQGPIISQAAGNQTVATVGNSIGNTIQTNTFQTHQTQNTHATLITNQTLQNSQHINHKKIKQKYDETFLNGPLISGQISGHVSGQVSQNGEINEDTMVHQMNQHVQDNDHTAQLQAALHHKRFSHNQSQLVGMTNQNYHQIMNFGGGESSSLEQSPDKRSQHKRIISNPTQYVGGQQIHQMQRASTSMGMGVHQGQNQQRQPSKNGANMVKTDIAFYNQGKQKMKPQKQQFQNKQIKQGNQMVGIKNLKRPNGGQNQKVVAQQTKRPGSNNKNLYNQPLIDAIQEQQEILQNSMQMSKFEIAAPNQQQKPAFPHSQHTSLSRHPSISNATAQNPAMNLQQPNQPKRKPSQNNANMQQNTGTSMKTKTPNQVKRPNPQTLIVPQSQIVQPTFKRSVQAGSQQQYQPQMVGGNTSNSSGALGIGLKSQQNMQSVYHQNGQIINQNQSNLMNQAGYVPQKSHSQKGLVSYNHQQYQQQAMPQTVGQGANVNSLGTIAPAVLPLSSQILNKQQLQQISNINSQTSQSIEQLSAANGIHGMNTLIQGQSAQNSPLKHPPKTIQQQPSKKLAQAPAQSQMGNYYQLDNQMNMQNAAGKKDALTFSMKKQNFRERTKAESMMMADQSASMFTGGQAAGGQNLANAAYLNQIELMGQAKHGGAAGHHRQLTSSGLQNPKTNGSSLLALPKDPREPQFHNAGANSAITTQHASQNLAKQLSGGVSNPATSKSQKSSTSRLINSSSWGGKHQANVMLTNAQMNGSAGSTERIKNMNQVQGLFDNIQGLKMSDPNNTPSYGGAGPNGVGEGNGAKGAATTSSKNSKTSLSSKRATGGQTQAVRGNKAGSLPSQHNKSNSASNQHAYPYQSSSTKSGGPAGAPSNNASKAQKQNPQNSNLSIAKIFQQKGLNYRGPSKVQTHLKSSKSSQKNPHNNVVIHQRGGVKVALTTSANTAVNTAQNSPRILNNKNSLYNKNSATVQGGSSSSRRKPSTSSMGHIVAGQRQGKFSKHHQGPPNFNNEANMINQENISSHRQLLDESNVQVTEVAYHGGPDSSERLLQMRQLEPSKLSNYSNMMNQNSQERLYMQNIQEHQMEKLQKSHKSSKSQYEKQQQANSDQINNMLDHQIKNSQDSLNKFNQNYPAQGLNNQLASLQISSQYSNQHQLTNPNHQFLDGGTGSNPNLINQQRSNTIAHAQNQNLNAHHQPNSLSLGQLSILEAQNNQLMDMKKIPSKYVKPQQNDKAQINQQKIQKKAQNHLKNFQKNEGQAANNKQEEIEQFVFNEAIEYVDDSASRENLHYRLPEGPLITEEEEQEIRQVASDINEKAFYGKVLRTKQIIEECKAIENDSQLRKLSPRSQEIAFVMKQVDQAFKNQGEAPETRLDFYRIGKMLGRGAFGKVNLAMHKLVRKLVALKSLNKECLTDEVQKQKLMKEVNLLLKLRHDHVVKIYETIETKKHIIIVMELCAGGDLLNYVRKRRRLKEPFAIKIFKQIIDGLNYIHSKCIAHRDIKLDNILLDGKGSVKIADFGVSKQCQPGVKMREQCGTPAYIAPEILKNKNGYGYNVDLWSAGVVLFAMLYGTVPFKAASMDELHSLILRGIYTLKDDISQEARDMLRGLLEINPHKRLTIEQILAHPWLQDYDEQLQLFNDQEREMIKKEYTYNDPSRYNRNENEEPVDCFTEHNIDSVYNTLKNCSEKSIILAPFNSTQSDDMEQFKVRIRPMMREKNIVLRLSRLCREIDRQYEFNNNGQLDNGVYHKQINNSADDASQDSGGKKSKRKKGNKDEKDDENTDDDDDADSESRFQVIQCSKSQGQEFLTEDYRENKKENENGFINNLIGNMTEAERQLIESTFGTNKEMDIDDRTTDKLVQFGYPKPYIQQSLQDNQPNYLTAGYYLLQMDQNYC